MQKKRGINVSLKMHEQNETLQRQVSKKLWDEIWE